MALSIGDVMKKDVVTLEPDTSLADMDRLFVSARISGAPVVSEGRLVGVVSRSDVIRALTTEQERAEAVQAFYEDPLYPYLVPLTMEGIAEASGSLAERLGKLRVGEVMSKKLITVDQQVSVEEAARKMASEGVHRILVTGEGEGRLVGLVSALDLVRLIGEFGLASH